MALDTSPSNLLEEIRQAEKLVESVLSPMEDQVKRYHGDWFRKDRIPDEAPYTENHYYEYISLVVPRIIFDNPRVRVSTRRTGAYAEVSKAIGYAVNRWTRDVRLRKLLVKAATDMMFNYGVVMTTRTPKPGYIPGANSRVDSMLDNQTEKVPFWPSAVRIPQQRFFMDPLAQDEDDARFKGHKWVIDKEDLIALAKKHPDQGWKLDVIENLPADSDLDTLKDRDESDVPRREVICYDVWVPEADNEEGKTEKEGYHGKIYTLAVGSTDNVNDPIYIREPQPYYGPRWGPYTMFGVYGVPNELYKLSPLVAVETQVQELNHHAQAVSRSAARYKKFVAYEKSDPESQQLIDSPDGYAVGVSGIENTKFIEATLGGTDRVQVEVMQLMKERLDRNSGIHDAQRGNVSGKGTATEVAVADEASSARMAFVKQQFADSVERLLRTVAWYCYHDDAIIFPLGEDAEAEFGPDPLFRGGNPAPGSGLSFDDLELEIEPYSMERTTEGLQQKRASELFAIVQQAAQMVPMAPWVNWKQLLDIVGDAYNTPYLGDIVDVEAAIEQQATAQEASKPRTVRQSGVTGAMKQVQAAVGQGRRGQPASGPPQGHATGAGARESNVG